MEAEDSKASFVEERERKRERRVAAERSCSSPFQPTRKNLIKLILCDKSV